MELDPVENRAEKYYQRKKKTERDFHNHSYRLAGNTTYICCLCLTELAAVKAKPPTNNSPDCTWTVYSLCTPVL